ncbi:MAG: AzlD domain-containing protein [Pseudomonadota bacterium]
MSEIYVVTLVLAAGTIAARATGALAGQLIPTEGRLAAALNALPGCLIVALVCVLVLGGGPNEWVAAALTLGVAIASRNLPLTMIFGVVAISVLRWMWPG